MKKVLRFSLAFLFVVMILTSCKKDSSSASSTNLIVGTWKDGDTTMKLGSDGSYLRYYGSSPYGSESQYRKGTYSYSASSNLIVVNVVAVPNHNGAYQDTYIVQTLTSSTLVLLYPDGDVEGYYTKY